MKVIKLKSNINTSALEFAMGYRGVTQSKLCKDIQGLSQPNLSKFLKGAFGCISECKLKEVMIYLNFPFEFIYKNFDNKFKFLS